MGALTVVAITHHHAPFATLEQVSLDADGADSLALAMHALPGVAEAVVLSTCNRTELYLAADSTHAAAALAILAAHTGVPAAELRSVAFVAQGDDASLHLFRVAAGLESRLVGEGEILRQVRATAARVGGNPAAGPRLTALFRWAAAAGRRARRDAAGPTSPSLACTALDAAGDHQPDDVTVVIGAGAMAAAVTAELRARRRPYLVAARRADSAALLARTPHDAVPLEELADVLGRATVVVCTTSARSPIVSDDTVRDSRRTSKQPLTIIDLSMPRNVDPAAGDLQDVRLVHLTDLDGSGGNLHERRARDVVTAEHDRYRLWLAGQAAGPVIAAFRRHVTDICLQEARRRVEPRVADVVAHRIAGRVLHAPTLAIKDLVARGDTTVLDAVASVLGNGTIPTSVVDYATAAS